MMWLFAILAVLALGAIAAVASGRGAPMSAPDVDRPAPDLPPTGELTAEQLRQVRFTTAVRGYRMDEVDALLARLAAQLEQPPRSPSDGIVDDGAER